MALRLAGSRDHVRGAGVVERRVGVSESRRPSAGDVVAEGGEGARSTGALAPCVGGDEPSHSPRALAGTTGGAAWSEVQRPPSADTDRVDPASARARRPRGPGRAVARPRSPRRRTERRCGGAHPEERPSSAIDACAAFALAHRRDVDATVAACPWTGNSVPSCRLGRLQAAIWQASACAHDSGPTRRRAGSRARTSGCRAGGRREEAVGRPRFARWSAPRCSGCRPLSSRTRGQAPISSGRARRGSRPGDASSERRDGGRMTAVVAFGGWSRAGSERGDAIRRPPLSSPRGRFQVRGRDARDGGGGTWRSGSGFLRRSGVSTPE